MNSHVGRGVALRWLLPVFAVACVGCDRRDLQPRTGSETAETVHVDPAAAAPEAASDPLPPPAPSPCAGLVGQRELDCLAGERRSREPSPAIEQETASDPPPPRR